MLKSRAIVLAVSMAKDHGHPVAVLKAHEGDYTVEINIERMRFLPENLVAIFWPGGKTMLNAVRLNLSMRMANEEWGVDL